MLEEWDSEESGDGTDAWRATLEMQDVISAFLQRLRTDFDSAVEAGEWEQVARITADHRTITGYSRWLNTYQRGLWIRACMTELTVANMGGSAGLRHMILH